MKHPRLSQFFRTLAVVGCAALRVNAQEGEASATEPTADATKDSTAPAENSEAGASSEAVASADTSASASDSSSASASPGLFEASTSGSSESSSASASPFKLGGYIRGDAYVGRAIGAAGEGDVKAAYGEVSLQASAEKESLGEAFADLRLRYGVQDGERRAFIELPQAYVHTTLGFFELTLGQQIIVWGESSQRSGSTIAAPSPIDTLAPISYRIRSPWEADRRQGNIAALVALNFNPIKLEAVYQPLYQAVEYPTYSNPPGTTPGKDLYPKFALAEGTLGARLHATFEVFHAALSFAQGYSGKPGVVTSGVDLSNPAQPLLLISRGAYKQQTMGVDIAVQPAKVVRIRAEAAYQSPRTGKAVYVPRAEVAYVAGVDVTTDNLDATVQYLGRQVMDFVKAPRVDQPPDALLAWRNQNLFQQAFALQHAVSLNWDLHVFDRALSLGAFAFVNFTSGERAINPRVRYHFSKSLTFSVGADIYQGPAGSLLGFLSPALTAGYGELKFAF